MYFFFFMFSYYYSERQTKCARAIVKLLMLIQPYNLLRQIIISDAKLWKILLYTALEGTTRMEGAIFFNEFKNKTVILQYLQSITDVKCVK